MVVSAGNSELNQIFVVFKLSEINRHSTHVVAERQLLNFIDKQGDYLLLDTLDPKKVYVPLAIIPKSFHVSIFNFKGDMFTYYLRKIDLVFVAIFIDH